MGFYLEGRELWLPPFDALFEVRMTAIGTHKLEACGFLNWNFLCAIGRFPFKNSSFYLAGLKFLKFSFYQSPSDYKFE